LCKAKEPECQQVHKFVSKMRKYFQIAVTFLVTATAAHAQNKMTPTEYIAKYRNYAIIEMHRSGVPASITLAQGLLESSNGNSRLARKGNNHFGIKCKSTWKGKTMKADDDAPNECFRAYSSALESYRDHSDFLRNNWRYHNLFDLEITNYKGWAEGLRKAGYATNKKYHTIIITLVERNKLYQYDIAPLPGQQNKPTLINNDLPALYAEKGATVKTIAMANDLKAKHIYRFNELPKGSEIKEGDIVYLKPKRRRGSVAKHVVKKGESMYQISQSYGIKLKHLYKKNRMLAGSQPNAGETIYMQKKRKKADNVDTLAPKEEAKIAVEAEFVNPNKIEKAPPIKVERIDVPEFHRMVSGETIYQIAEKYHVFEEDIIKWNNLDVTKLQVGQKIYLNEKSARIAARIVGTKVYEPKSPKKTEPSVTYKYHTVKAGETVYRICKNHGISSEDFKKWNKMTDNTVKIGQKLIVGIK
jgi:flagellum-specific peptidoglycan hydrolase FlgJ/LysM repeat protein